MSRRAAILGLGARGTGWAQSCAASGWQVVGFDPDAAAGPGLGREKVLRRAVTISEAVQQADVAILCLPERLELMQMVLQRAQASGRDDTILCVASQAFDVDAIQARAIRPGQIFRLAEADGGAVTLDVSPRNTPDACKIAETLLAELMAHRSLVSQPVETDYSPDAESA